MTYMLSVNSTPWSLGAKCICCEHYKIEAETLQGALDALRARGEQRQLMNATERVKAGQWRELNIYSLKGRML